MRINEVIVVSLLLLLETEHQAASQQQPKKKNATKASQDYFNVQKMILGPVDLKE
jgi:hypothetical protein